MAIPTWTVGEVLSASDVNNWFVPWEADKSSDTSRASTTTLTADPALVISGLPANSKWDVDAYFQIVGAAPGSGDFKFQFTAPAGATCVSNVLYNATAGTGAAISGNVGLNVVTVGSATGGTFAKLDGTLSISSTSGAFTLTWAQGTSSGTATVLKAGSSLVLRRIG